MNQYYYNIDVYHSRRRRIGRIRPLCILKIAIFNALLFSAIILSSDLVKVQSLSTSSSWLVTRSLSFRGKTRSSCQFKSSFDINHKNFCGQCHNNNFNKNIIKPNINNNIRRWNSDLSLMPMDMDHAIQMIPTDAAGVISGSIDTIHHAFSTFSHTILADNAPVAAVQQPVLSISPEEGSIGHDIFIFLIASVFIVPFCKLLDVPPVLGFLLIGCILGPHGFQLFSNSEQDIELGMLETSELIYAYIRIYILFSFSFTDFEGRVSHSIIYFSTLNFSR